MTRDEFKDFVVSHFTSQGNGNISGLGIYTDEEPFWIPEFRVNRKANYFIECRVVGQGDTGCVEGFWNWCRNNLTKVPMCFMSSSEENKEWWGFNTEKDVMMFLLRWS